MTEYSCRSSIIICHVQSTNEDQSGQDHVVVLELVSVNTSDTAGYECLVKPYDGAAVAATVNLTVYGKIHSYILLI